MPVLIGNTVKTATADYPCATREEAEALFLALSRPHPAQRDEVDSTDNKPARDGKPS